MAPRGGAQQAWRVGAQGARQCSTGFLRLCVTAALGCAILLGLGGCSAARFGYAHGDSFALIYLDRYLDLDAAQKAQARAGLQRLFAWHRAQELPRVEHELAGMQAALDQEVGLAQLERLQAAAMASVERTAEQALPDLIGLARSLRPEQFAHLRQAFERANADYRDDYLDLAPAARHERRVDRFIERMEPWFGGFDRRQRAQIGDWLRAVPEEPAVREAQRRARQDDLLALLWTLHRADLTHDEARQELLAYLGRLNWQSAAPGAAQARQDRQAGMTVVLRVINTATPAQKAAARKRLQGWRDDIVALMRQSAA